VKRLVALAVLFLTLAAPAAAQTTDEIAREAVESGSYVQPGADADAGRLDDVVADASGAGTRFIAVILAEDPPGGAVTVADRILDIAGTGTALVLSPGFVGYRSTVFSDEALDEADEESQDAGDDVAIVAAFADSLEDADDGSGSSGGGFGGTLLLVGLFVVGIPLLLAFVSRSRRPRVPTAEEAAASVAEARRELERQVAAMADAILELSDRVQVSENDAAAARFAEANSTYLAVSQDLPQLDTVPELEAAADRLDRARWQIEATRAALEGRPPPPEPVDGPSSCFFDPNHGAGVERAEVKTGGQTRSVLVCRVCADLLAKGQAPAPRTIVVGGQQVPAASAPRSYGGGGMGLFDVFSIFTGGGMASGHWGGYYGPGYRRRRYGGLGWGGGFGGFGGGFGGGIAGGVGRRGSGGFGGGGRRSGGGHRRGGRSGGGRRR
jgi:hypothetical protein